MTNVWLSVRLQTKWLWVRVQLQSKLRMFFISPEKVDIISDAQLFFLIYIFFSLGFPLRTFTVNKTAEEGEGYFCNSSLPLPHASKTFGFERKSLKTKLRAQR